jgi:hypothetical protein
MTKIQVDLDVPREGRLTLYGDTCYRSTLEARWACFFGSLRIPYVYEKRPGYRKLYYVPDFWLPTMRAWVEIKPTLALFDSKAREKANRLVRWDRQPLIILTGTFTDSPPTYYGRLWVPTGSGDYPVGQIPDVRWQACSTCNTVGLVFRGDARLLACGCPNRITDLQQAVETAPHPHIVAAFQGATNFEFTFMY